MCVDREKALEQGEKLNVVGGPAWRTGFPHETVCCHEGRGGHFCPEISRQACWRAKMPTPARRAAYCWVRKTSAECRATKYWRYFSIAKELSLSKYTSFPWFYWIRDFVTLQNTVFLIAKSGKEIKFLSPCYARRKRKKLGTQKQLQEGKRCCKVTNVLFHIPHGYSSQKLAVKVEDDCAHFNSLFAHDPSKFDPFKFQALVSNCLHL